MKTEKTKWVRGKAFPHCYCCRLTEGLKKTLTLHNRSLRRRHRQNLKKEAKNADTTES